MDSKRPDAVASSCRQRRRAARQRLADNARVASKRRAALGILAALAVLAAGPEAAAPPAPPAFGLDVNLPAGTPAAEQQRAFELVRRSGVSLYALTLSWSAAEPAPGKYKLEDLIRTARLLRQSGALLHLDLPLVAVRARDVPADLSNVAFDDSRLSLRLGRLLDALEPALRDVGSISLGYEADVYFVDKPDELRAYRRLFDAAVHFLERKIPRLAVGVTTLAPTESPSPEVAAALHQRSPVLFYVYAPFESGKPWRHRPPDALEKDWRALLSRAGEHRIAFPEVSYSSAAENASSPEQQAEFVRRLRRFVSAADARRLLFARWVSWRDAPGSETGGDDASGPRAAFLGNRGLERADGSAKPAWKMWVRGARP
jgi:hypothetical protein